MIEVQNLSKKYYRREALKNVDFSIKAGEIFGLLGPNGAGKTSLIRIITGIIRPDEGAVLWDDRPMDAQSFQKIGYLPEERGLYPNMRVDQQIRYFAALKGMNHKQVDEQLEHWKKTLDIDDWIHLRVNQISKGMAQKIQFLITIIHQPELIILDEPFTGFDPINQSIIEKIIFDFRDEGKYVILSTHNMNAVENICTDIGLLNHGEKVLQDKISTLQEGDKSPVYSIEFKGNMIAFTNALWAGYELIKKHEHSDTHFTAFLKMRRDNKLSDLVNAVKDQVEVLSVQPAKEKMQDVFVKHTTEITEDA